MKRLKSELDVDFIGGLPTITKEEIAAISEYIRQNKDKIKLKETKRIRKAA